MFAPELVAILEFEPLVFNTFYPSCHTQKLLFNRRFCLAMVIRAWEMEIPTPDLA